MQLAKASLPTEVASLGLAWAASGLAACLAGEDRAGRNACRARPAAERRALPVTPTAIAPVALQILKPQAQVMLLPRQGGKPGGMATDWIDLLRTLEVT